MFHFVLILKLVSHYVLLFFKSRKFSEIVSVDWYFFGITIFRTGQAGGRMRAEKVLLQVQ